MFVKFCPLVISYCELFNTTGLYLFSRLAGPMLEGYQSRLFEFTNFERKFEECISRSAVKTKFAQHSRKGKLMVSELMELMSALLERCRAIR